ncbi:MULTISPECIES: hypothetical protein [Bradyrhizobium]|uniref:hypothetical protein n=1 Tax=Bradyrhizobium TaxID=374 RepID=UPI001EDB629F|nr:hypothetical protein [Bradyrhizobium zhengyangense]MCG2643795.1 hypothetical protein [Bradyrhizobium zhengyangense]
MPTNDTFGRKAPPASSSLATRALGLAVLIVVLLAQAPSEMVRGADVIAYIEREEVNLLGYLAAGLVLATFCMRSMTTLRTVALASNVAFIGYGYLANLTPVLLLHVILLPVNTYRLVQICRVTTASP